MTTLIQPLLTLINVLIEYFTNANALAKRTDQILDNATSFGILALERETNSPPSEYDIEEEEPEKIYSSDFEDNGEYKKAKAIYDKAKAEYDAKRKEIRDNRKRYEEETKRLTLTKLSEVLSELKAVRQK